MSGQVETHQQTSPVPQSCIGLVASMTPSRSSRNQYLASPQRTVITATRRVRSLLGLVLLCASSVHAIDIGALWVSGDPVASEERMQEALRAAAGDDSIIIQTQIARTYVFRKDFSQAREILGSIASEIEQAGPEAQARYWLELGRSYASHQHPPGSQTDEMRRKARGAYDKAIAIAKNAGIDNIRIDALHMLPFVDTLPEEQLAWTKTALDVVLASNQAAARSWEPSIRSNLGEAYLEAGRNEEALEQFLVALALRSIDGAPRVTLRDATWHVARTLRNMGRYDRALQIQQRLANESVAESAERPYIYDELASLYRTLGDLDRAQHFADHSAALSQ